MKPEELRIGNYIKGGKVKVISPGLIEFEKKFKSGYRSYGIDHPNCKPILLTEEWLLNFGFERVKHRSGIQAAYKLKNLRLNMSNCGNFYRYKLPIDYIHQLQNLYFALTEIELTIN